MSRRRGRGGYGRDWGGGYGGFAPYVPVAKRRARAERMARDASTKGRPLQSVQSKLRGIAATFWGLAWCRNLETYSDYENRLPRGRTYLRNGSVIDLRIARGRVDAWVSGSEPYQIRIDVEPLAARRWQAVRRACAGSVASLVELLEGRLSRSVMELLTSTEDGLFPAPGEIRVGCSCPDHADVCKHVAAVLYGIGVRFDADPTTFFVLRGVDHSELIASAAATGLGERAGRAAAEAQIAEGDLAKVFGIELDDEAPPAPAPARRTGRRDAPGRRRGRAPSVPSPSATDAAKGGAAAGTSPGPAVGAGAGPDSGSGRMTAAELLTAGIPRSTITGWVRRGVLTATQERGVYSMNDATGPAIEAWLARRGPPPA